MNQDTRRHCKMLRRRELAAALTEEGYKISPATLSTLATIGGGPRFRKFGRYPIYDFDEALQWARSRCTPVVTSTSELLTHRPLAASLDSESSEG